MWRRAFLVLACAAIPWAEPAPAQQPAVPVVGFLRSTPAAPFANNALPAIYDQRDIVAAGGLIGYAARFTDAYRQAGVYGGRILGGAKVSELPVLQPAKFELVVNARTAKHLGLEIPRSILLRADEVIEWTGGR